MSDQCRLDASAPTHGSYGIALIPTGTESPPPPTIPPDGDGNADGTVTQLGSAERPLYMVQFAFGAGSIRYLWAARDGFAVNIIQVPEDGAPAAGTEPFDVAGATAAINEILAEATATAP